MKPRQQAWLLVLPASLFLLAFFAYPLLSGLHSSLQPSPHTLSASNYTRFFADPDLRATVWTTFRLSIPATVLSLLLALPCAYFLRSPSRVQKWTTIVFLLPITFGSVLVADGMLSYYANNGWFWQFAKLLGIHGRVALIHSFAGVLLSLVIAGFPFAFLFLLSFISGIDPNLARAAATLGAGPWRQFRHVYAPLLVPGLRMTAILVFVQSFAVFPSAVLLGIPSGATRVMSIAAAHAAFDEYNYSMGNAISLLMGLIQFASVGLLLLATRKAFRGSSAGFK
ncbi:inner membrane ABC transporter permease protein YcjO [mine drainage metagenome]|uniref:Inner membrane ABC transporter permease protein YcjO n=1 Tax=mine drainage metagenome TaxID=410659 RepID=A0A1J5R8V4_9ZZZZ